MHCCSATDNDQASLTVRMQGSSKVTLVGSLETRQHTVVTGAKVSDSGQRDEGCRSQQSPEHWLLQASEWTLERGPSSRLPPTPASPSSLDCCAVAESGADALPPAHPIHQPAACLYSLMPLQEQKSKGARGGCPVINSTKVKIK